MAGKEVVLDMTVKEFLERQKEANPVAALGFLMDLLTLLDEFDQDKCCTLAGKIRAQTGTKEMGWERSGK